MMAGYKVPGGELYSMIAVQGRNIEALTAANQLALEGVQAVVRRHMDIMRHSLGEMSSMAAELMSTGSPEARLAKQAELTKTSFERTIAHLTELSEMIAKSNGEAVEVISKRVSRMLDEG